MSLSIERIYRDKGITNNFEKQESIRDKMKSHLLNEVGYFWTSSANSYTKSLIYCSSGWRYAGVDDGNAIDLAMAELLPFKSSLQRIHIVNNDKIRKRSSSSEDCDLFLLFKGIGKIEAPMMAY